jgi:hypothetical protein
MSTCGILATKERVMDPVAAASASAILEGYRRAMWRSTSLAVPRTARHRVTLTDVVENATEHAQALVPRDPATGLRLDRKV